MAWIQEQKKIQKKKRQKSSEYFENIFENLKNLKKKKQKKRTMISCGRHLQNWMEILDWMKTMSHRWMDGCLSADGQKTRVYENPCRRGLQEGRPSGDLDGNTRLDENHVPKVDASLEMDRERECMKNPWGPCQHSLKN